MPATPGPRLLVLSDIHADDHSFEVPLGPDAPRSQHGRSSWIDFADPDRCLVDPLETFQSLIHTNGIRADYLVVPGDICDKANGKALRAAWAKLNEIADHLGGAEIVATAGNHDLDSRYRHHPYDPRNVLRALQPSFQTSTEPDINAYWANGLAILQRDNIRFVLLNSCAYHGSGENELNYGRIDELTLDAFRRRLEEPTPFVFNVLLCHHSPIPFPVVGSDPQDHMRNGQNLVQALNNDNKLWIVIHGHRHAARIWWGPGDFSSPVLLAAGAMGARIPAPYNLRVRNQVHFVELFSNVSPDIQVGGTIQTWDYVVDFGWEKALPLDGLPAQCGFGHRGNPSVLAGRVQSAFESHGGPIPWQLVQEEVPEIAFLTPHSYKAFVDRLELEFSLRIVPSADSPMEIARKSS
jgi:predicted phosphodiesterase